MQDLTAGIIQLSITPNNPQVNLDNFSRCLHHEQAGDCDLIVLPEAFITGFCTNARQFAQPVDGPVYQWMADHASRLNAVITGSVIIKENDTYYNRLIWMRPDGSYTSYNKRHLFRMGGEHERYQSGSERVLVELNGWRILPMICYDLRFPVWSRNNNDYDMAIYIANWPSARALHWNSLLRARAIENLSYIIGVNRIGHDESGQHYAGDSAVYGPRGEILLDPQDDAGLFITTLSTSNLQTYREQFPAHLDADSFELKI